MEDRLSTARPQMRRVLERIEQSLSERLTIAGMAAWANMSPFHFAREFKRLTGMPPHHYVKTRRLHLSRQMLRASNLSIGEIAYRVGFLSPSHFSAEFRKVTGVKPADWRREQRSCGPNPQDPDTADLQETVSL